MRDELVQLVERRLRGHLGADHADRMATREMGFAAGLGILLAALVVSTLLVPALTALVGRRAFRLDWTAEPADAHAERPLAA
jgi:uncharacterized membrane protein YdfJ with MMPL/SSD domain